MRYSTRFCDSGTHWKIESKNEVYWMLYGMKWCLESRLVLGTCLVEKGRQFLRHQLPASKASRSIFFVLVVKEELTSSALDAINAHIDWSVGEDAFEVESIQIIVRFEGSHQIKSSDAWHCHNRWFLIVLLMMKSEIVSSGINHQANRTKVWEFGQAASDLGQ